jgi:FUSC-like inner membrane protein yccS
VRTAARARRPPRVPEWLTELAQSSGGPVPWAQMGHAVLAIAAPVAVGLAAGHLVAGLLAGVGGLLATMADRAGPYLMRVRRVATAAVFGGAAGLLIGTAINGRGWVAVPVMIVVAGVSALLSSVGAVWSSASLFLLIYAALGTGPVGALRPWWLTVLWFLAGVGWWLVLLVPGWLAFPRAVEQRQVAAVYRALAVNLRALGTEDLGAARRGAVAALNLAFEELLGQRAAASGRDRELALLMSLIRQARLAAEAAAGLDYLGERPPPQAAAHADALASAVLDGAAVPALEAPPAASRAMLAL